MGLNPKSAFKTIFLEDRWGKGNSTCSGEMRRYVEEHQWRRRFSNLYLTLRRESKGSKQD
ncbi:Putative uncharacterized protein [Chlamydia pneumoniae]|uniref:Uncharacterized protein n=1 Tax=Chlamydia pneumoniae TaxID=83558 RepID=A0A0F7XDN7_CHLPN|nr:Putative uncharacterized protein [Chlamydia pneumoniae]CRI36267.1 Putative uncharacterized protein [Chlamydia pneumoniae]CRI37394.1 Putative uncharacterized protein [Chlamydia pneumoniae]CRI38523.1 Putative uncharacterized protein [Chlamydia pneumoniae]CRI39655.1 Putative uncharacterized protein [Chlamydia pneumoniae]